jgi:hypothetical protein
MFCQRYLFWIVLLCSNNLYALEKWHTQFELMSRGLYLESATQQARSFGIEPRLFLQLDLANDLFFHAQASALLETGAHKGTILDEFKPDQQVLLGHAYFDYRPWQNFSARLGALPMREYAQDLLITNTRFLGLTGQQRFNLWSDARVNFYALGAIPSNQELTNRLGGVSEGTPSYWQSGFTLELPGDVLAINLKTFAWGYDNVTGNVAFQSGFMGNQTNGIGSANTKLNYQFKGLSNILELSGELSTWSWLTAFEYIYNDGAPSGRNQAKRVRLQLGPGQHLLNLAWYEIESDAVIGYYNSSLLGHTNRRGYSLDYIYQQSQESSSGLTLVRAKTIRSNLLQSDQDAISLWWKIALK